AGWAKRSLTRRSRYPRSYVDTRRGCPWLNLNLPWRWPTCAADVRQPADHGGTRGGEDDRRLRRGALLGLAHVLQLALLEQRLQHADLQLLTVRAAPLHDDVGLQGELQPGAVDDPQRPHVVLQALRQRLQHPQRPLDRVGADLVAAAD